MNFIVQPLRGMGNFLGTDVVDAKERKADELKKEPEKEKIERKAARESIEVYRAINEQVNARARCARGVCAASESNHS